MSGTRVTGQLVFQSSARARFVACGAHFFFLEKQQLFRPCVLYVQYAPGGVQGLMRRHYYEIIIIE